MDLLGFHDPQVKNPYWEVANSCPANNWARQNELG